MNILIWKFTNKHQETDPYLLLAGIIAEDQSCSNKQKPSSSMWRSCVNVSFITAGFWQKSKHSSTLRGILERKAEPHLPGQGGSNPSYLHPLPSYDFPRDSSWSWLGPGLMEVLLQPRSISSQRFWGVEFLLRYHSPITGPGMMLSTQIRSDLAQPSALPHNLGQTGW